MQSITGAAGVFSLSNVLFASIMLVMLARSEYGAIAAVITSATYFAVTNLLAAVAVNGSLERIIIHRQDQITVRRYNDQAAPRALAADVPQLAYTPPAPPQLPGSTFVPAVDLSVAKDAVLWALTLYGPDGKADPAKVNLKGGTEPPGRLKCAAPGPAAKEYLLTKRVIERIDHGYKLRIDRYPTVDHVRGLLS